MSQASGFEVFLLQSQAAAEMWPEIQRKMRGSSHDH